MPDTNSILGTLKIEHSVDPNGSLCLNVPIKVPPAKLAPQIAISYHSAIYRSSVLGHGWELKAFGSVQRTGRTIAQDGVSGSVNYDANDRYTLNGQRLVKLSEKEYRFEVDQWSKLEAEGADPANPDSWIEYLPNGTIRRYGSTNDSKALAIGQEPATRMWALAEICDSFSNYTSYSYMPADNTGSLILDSINYGGNRSLKMEHQRKLKFSYTDRIDIYKEFEGGSPVSLTKRLASISASFNGNLIHTHTFDYDYAPVTGVSRLQSIALSDATGVSVSPLAFTWSNSVASVFDDLSVLNPISPDVSDVRILPVDVNGSGRTSLVLAWKEWNHDLGINVLCLGVHLADGKGNISTEPQPGSGSTGLPDPDQLLALDVDGDGKMDLLHVLKDDSQGVYTLTTLLSTEDGYKPQNPTIFRSDILDGQYYIGDFQGNGNVGLVYLYSEGDNDVRLIQFTSDGKFFSPQPVVDGPSAIDIMNAQVVIADFDGNGASDIFLISPKGSSGCEINFFQSQGGYLQAKLGDQNPFTTISDHIEWLEGTAFLALPEQDGKTGLLLLSKSDSGELVFQTLRSTGKSLEVSPSKTTTVFYGETVNLGHTTSINSFDLVTTFKHTGGIEVSVLHFFNDTFEEVTRVTLGTDLEGFDLNFVDLRGIGRADCLFSLYNDFSEKLELLNLPCAGAAEAPVDFIIGYMGGLGATLSATYAPLTNGEVYTGSDKDSRAPVNALCGRTSSMLVMSGSTLQPHAVGSTRTRLAHFPKYVVEELTDSSHPGAVLKTKYFYTNGRISFDGRGWIGFDTISRHSDVLGTVETNTYFQEFPFIGAVSKTEVVSASDPGNILKSTSYAWKKHSTMDQNTHCYTTMSSIQQTLFEKGHTAYYVDVGHVYDSYANIVQTTITTGPTEKPSLVIVNEYSNDVTNWIIGSKLSESITSEGRLMKRTNIKYITGKQVVSQIREWISELSSSEKDYSFDAAGNVTMVTGPWQAQKALTYDSTYSFLTKETISVDAESSLTTSALYDYGTGQATSITEYNGHITTQGFDILGRVIERAEGERSDNMTVIDKWEYGLDRDGHAVRTHSSLCDQVSNSWRVETEYLDGMGRTWKKAVPSVSDPSVTVYADEVVLDGAGRIIRRYRNYTSTTSQPAYSTYSYDAFSRKTKVVTPPAVSGKDPVTTTYDYSCENHLTTVTQTRSGDSHHGSTTTRTVLEYFTNPETPSPDFVVPLSVTSTDELGYTITTAFDALHRVVSVTDAGGVCMSQQWDGISRQTSRKITNPEGMNPSTITHFSIDYDDAFRKTTINNLCIKSSTVILKDYLNRTTKRTTPNEEELSFKYDDVQARAQGRLSSVISSKGASEAFSYDKRGSLQSTSLAIDGINFTTSFEYTTSRQLSKIVNPDGSALTRMFFDNSNTVKNVQLLDDRSGTSVSTTFNKFDNAFFMPQTRDMGNGLKSTSSLSDSGFPMKAVLSKGDTTLLQQTWELNNFGRLDAYNPSSSEDTKRIFQYDTAGQLLQSQSAQRQTSIYSYDQSGNILSKDGNSFLNHGWQLGFMIDSSGNRRSFEYTADGNLTKEIDLDSNRATRNMSYDSRGRMTSVNSTTFIYDSRGRMIKATSGDSTVTYYPSEWYEVSVKGNTTTQTAYLIHQVRHASISTVIDSEKARQTSALYYHHDHLGSIVAVSDGGGEIVTKYWYDDFGTVTRVDGRDDSSRYKYSGKEEFEGLYYFGARFYDPKTGRFTALDNIHIPLKGIVPATFNQYAFSRNDPVNFIDFNGNAPSFWHRLWHLLVDVAIIGIGIAVSAFLSPAVGEILIGGGIGGLAYDLISLVSDPGDDYDKQWGIAVISGAVFSGIGMAAEKGLEITGILSNLTLKIDNPALANTYSRLGWKALRGGIKFGTDVSIATVDGISQQVTYNLITPGRNWNDALPSAVIGGVLGYLATRGFAKVASRLGEEAGEIFRARRAARGQLERGRSGSIEMELINGRNSSRRRTGSSFDFGSDDYWWDSLSTTSSRGDDYWWDPMGTEWDGYLADILD